MIKNLKWFSISLVFIIGLIFYLSKSMNLNEGMGLMDNSKKSRMCGNLLVKEGNQIKLYNSNTARVPGVNPIVFNNLEEYGEFVEWLKSQNIHCPVLVLEESYNAQGDKTYVPNNDVRFLGNVSDDLIQLPYEGDGTSMVQPTVAESGGKEPPFDAIENGKSPFATDPNWGGPGYSQQLLDAGVFDEDKVYVKR